MITYYRQNAFKLQNMVEELSEHAPAGRVGIVNGLTMQRSAAATAKATRPFLNVEV